MNTLKEKLKDIVANHPGQIKESREHRPGEVYVKIGRKRVYFRRPTLEITGIYEKNRLAEALRKVKKPFRDFFYYRYWMVLFKPVVAFLLLSSIAIFYFGFVEPKEAKIRRVEKICSSLTGYKAEYMSDGRIRLSGARKGDVYGPSEPTVAVIDPLGWLLGKNSEVTRHLPDGGVVTEPFDYDGGEVWLNREKKKWISGNMSEENIKWDEPQGTTVRKEKISATTIKNE